MEQRSLFGLSEHLERISKNGDPLEILEATVDFEYFRGWLVEGLGYGDGARGGRPPFDPVSMFKALILQAQHNLSDAKMEFMIRDRLSWMRFLGFDLGGPTPDENTIRHFRNRLTETGTLKRVMKAFDWQLQKKGYIPMSGQIVDVELVAVVHDVGQPGEGGVVELLHLRHGGGQALGVALLFGLQRPVGPGLEIGEFSRQHWHCGTPQRDRRPSCAGGAAGFPGRRAGTR